MLINIKKKTWFIWIIDSKQRHCSASRRALSVCSTQIWPSGPDLFRSVWWCLWPLHQQGERWLTYTGCNEDGWTLVIRIWQRRWSLVQENEEHDLFYPILTHPMSLLAASGLSLSRGVRAILGEECDHILVTSRGHRPGSIGWAKSSLLIICYTYWTTFPRKIMVLLVML